jgi:hypothetical protein
MEVYELYLLERLNVSESIIIEELVEHYTKTNRLEHSEEKLIKFNLDLTLF